jgi:hypothetical protein
MRTVSWIGQDGKAQFVATITVSRGIDVETKMTWADGDEIEITERHEIESTAITVAKDATIYADLYDTTANLRRCNQLPAEYAMGLNNGKTTIGIKESVAVEIKAAIASAKAEAEIDPEWTAILERRAGVARAIQSERDVERAMTLGGHTY